MRQVGTESLHKLLLQSKKTKWWDLVGLQSSDFIGENPEDNAGMQLNGLQKKTSSEKYQSREGPTEEPRFTVVEAD